MNGAAFQSLPPPLDVWLLHGRTWHAPLTDFMATRVEQALLADTRARVTVTSCQLPDGAGIYELPQELVRRLDELPQPHAVIALGVVIQGGSKHDEDVAYAAAQCLLHLGLERRLPVVWGVVHAATLAAAEARTTGPECAAESYAKLAVTMALQK